MARAKLANALQAVRHIALDTSVFLMAADPDDPRHECAVWLLDEIARGRFECEISTICAAELLTGAVLRGASRGVATQTLLRQYPHLRVEPVTLDVAADAAELRVATRLRLPDALIIATALVGGLDALVHGDTAWTSHVGPHVTGLLLVDLNEYC